MIKDKLYDYFSIDNADFDFNLCEQKEEFLKALENSTPQRVEKFHSKGTNSDIKYGNVASQFTLCINKAELCTSDYCDFSLGDFMLYLAHLAYYDDKPLMCSFHDEGQFSLLLAIPYDENSLRISVFNRPTCNDYKCSTDIIINKDTFLFQIKDILENEIKSTERKDEGHPNHYVDLMKSAVEVLKQYFDNPVEFKKTYDIPQHFRVFDIAYKNLDGIWEFCVCLDDDEKADPDYWEQQKQEGKILDYDYYEQYSKSCYQWDHNLKRTVRLSKEEIRKIITTNMYERVEERNWVYCRDTNNWYSENEIMLKPERTLEYIYGKFSYDIEFDKKSYPYSEDEIIRSYVEHSYDENGVLLPDKYDWGWMTCYIIIKSENESVCKIEFNYRENQEIRAALEKIKTEEYVRFGLGEYERNKMHLWRNVDKKGNVSISVACYKRSRDEGYTKDNRLYYFTSSEEFIDCFASALDEIEHKINVMKNVLKAGQALEIENKFVSSDRYNDEFGYLEPFVGDYACVDCGYDGWSIINRDFEWVIKADSVTILGKEHPKWGKQILGSIKRFQHLHNIDGKLFIATKDDNKQFVMDIEGDIQIPHVCDKIYYTYLNNEIWFLVIDADKTYIVNSEGKDVLTLNFVIDEKFWLFDKVIIVSKDNKYGIINWKGETIIDFIFSEINPKENDLDFIPAKYINRWGFVSQDGKIYSMKVKEQSEADVKCSQVKND